MSGARGMVAVDEVLPLAVSARAEVLADLVRVLTEAPVHEVRNVGADQLLALRRVRPRWATLTGWLLALPTLGLGLLLLRVRRESSLSLRLLTGAHGVDVALEGSVPRETLERLRALRATVASRTPRRPAPMVAPAPVTSLPSAPPGAPHVATPASPAAPAPLSSAPLPPAPLAPPPLGSAPPAPAAPALDAQPPVAPAPGAAPSPPAPWLLPAPPSAPAEDRTVRRAALPGRAGPEAAPPPPPTLSVVLDTGQRVAVDGVVLVGRDPAPGPGEAGARLVRLDDPDRSVSKTHLSLHLDDGTIWIVDRHSTNGVEVVAGGVPRRAEPGVPLALPAGSVARFGDRELRLAEPD